MQERQAGLSYLPMGCRQLWTEPRPRVLPRAGEQPTGRGSA